MSNGIQKSNKIAKNTNENSKSIENKIAFTQKIDESTSSVQSVLWSKEFKSNLNK